MADPVAMQNFNNNNDDDEDRGGDRVFPVDETNRHDNDTDANNRQPHHHHEGDDEDEEECRVCRGPAEEGHPLFKPCKCSGSIGLTHQDCLRQWLTVQRSSSVMGVGGGGGDDRCELCKTKFSFAPLYAPDAPDRLPADQVLWGLVRRAMASWLPFVLRCLFAASLWLLVAPLLTNYLYQAWMHRPSAIWDRFNTHLVWGDLVSGAVIAACILVSFLSLMSFADFLRMELQQRGWGGAGGVNNNNNNNNNNVDRRLGRQQRPDEPVLQPSEAIVDDELYSQAQLAHRMAVKREGPDNRTSLAHPTPNRLDQNVDNVDVGHDNDGDDDDDDDDDASDRARREEDDDDDESDSSSDHDMEDDHEDDALFNLDQDEVADLQEEAMRLLQAGNAPPRVPNMQQNNLNNNARNNMDRLNNNFDLDADDAMDMDINIALDELLGIRGPLRAVVRNLLWLLAFNAIYLGFFTFFPRLVGTALLSAVFNIKAEATGINSTVSDLVNAAVTKAPTNATLRLVPQILRGVFHYITSNASNVTTSVSHADITNISTSPAMNVSEASSFYEIIAAIEAESVQQNTTFRLSDLVNVTIGYLVFAAAVIFMRSLWALSKRLRFIRAGRGRTENGDLDDDFRLAFDEINRRLGGNDMNQWADEQAVPLSFAVGLALDALTAIVKVGILLLLKMFLLPIGLGICLDLSTLSLFGADIASRVAYAGKDLFAFTLLHWVAGITFMLLVTVSVLQLREVAHPDLLAQVIRPQEPQPDLLGNLLHESVSTHSKRMVLSLIIYAALLTLHIYIPVRLFVQSGLFQRLSFLQFKTSYILMPELQVPLELLFFHLCMLGLLEKNKNLIGEIQHNWLKLMCRCLGFVECVLPLTVTEFKLVGRRPVRLQEDPAEIDPFWFDLANCEKERENLIKASLNAFEPYQALITSPGDTKPNGERVLRFGADYIRLPVKSNDGQPTTNLPSVLLPTKIGRYRLKRDVSRKIHTIQLWEEVPGVAIPRPPEGWDDLGAGGADEQGRWAWGREKKSTTERGVAHRSDFFQTERNKENAAFVSSKLLLLAFLSWMATSLILSIIVIGPLAIGRFFYFVYRVPIHWIHDPFAFALGSLVFFPTLRLLLAGLFHGEKTFSERLSEWAFRSQVPPSRKIATMAYAGVLAGLVAPLLLGSVIDLMFLRSSAWFMGPEHWIDSESIVLNWIAGLILLSTWAYLCVLKFFTKAYWKAQDDEDAADEARGRQRNPNRAEGAQADDPAVASAEGGHPLNTWQGERGRIGTFFSIWKAVIVDWEWDKVDEIALLRDVAIPISCGLASALFLTLTSLALCCWRNVLLSPWLRASVVRGILFLSGLAQAVIVWRREVHEWFEAAHAAARDDRFLIGEILQNYEG